MKKSLLIFSFGFFYLSFSISAQAQLFQNNNTSCEDFAMIAEFDSLIAPPLSIDSGVACGRFTDDTAAGQLDFPDCATVADAIFNSTDFPDALTNSVLINTGAHGQNCFNAGEPNHQMMDPVFLQNDDLIPVTDGNAVRMGSIVAGNLRGTGLDDLAMVLAFNPDAPLASKEIEEVFNTGMGFGPPLDTDSALLEPAAPVPFIPFPVNPVAGPVGFISFNADRSLVLLNCDADEFDEAVVVANNNAPATNDSPVLVVMQNSGSGLEDGASPITLPVLTDDVMRGSLASGDFNGDGILDLAVAIDAIQPDAPTLVLCQGGDNCSFTCPNQITDPNVVPIGDPSASPDPTSVVAGDVDGDQDIDVVVAETDTDALGGETDVRYYLNNGGNLDTWPTLSFVLRDPGDTAFAQVLTLGRFSNEAVQLGIDELAVNFAHGGMTSVASEVVVITTDGAGGFNTPTRLSLDANLPASDLLLPLGIDSKDFDHCGGDDIIALSLGITLPTTVDGANASVFLNANEPPDVAIDPNLPSQILLNNPVNVPTTCTDPTLDDRTFQWTVVTQPVGSVAVFGTPSGALVGDQDDASTTFVADLPGDYTIQIDCTDFCGLTDEDLDQIQITFTVVQALTQGDNLFNCSLGTVMPISFRVSWESMAVLWVLSVPVGIWLFRMRRRCNS